MRRGVACLRTFRTVLAIVLCVVLVPVTVAVAFPEPNDRSLCPPNRVGPPRGDHSPDTPIGAPVVRLLNPVAFGASPPEVSDRYDGTDRRFHLTAVAPGAPQEAVVEAYVQTGDGSPSLLGTLCPVAGTPDTFEGFWDIPELFPEGPGSIGVKLFDRGGEGAAPLAEHSVSVNVQHRDVGSAPAAESVALIWPMNDGPFGFFRNRSGQWKGNVEAIGSSGASSFDIRYSTSPLTSTPAFKSCGTGFTTATRASDSAKIVTGSCTLSTSDRPSSVTAVAVVARGTGDDSSDAHRVRGFVQDPRDMKVTLTAVNPASPTASWPSGRRRVVSQCLEYKARVEDLYGRPVVGANVDVEVAGPRDSASFGDPTDAAAPEAATVTENSVRCPTTLAPDPGEHGTQHARRLVADGPDVKAIESATTGTTSSGEWIFKVFSPDPGSMTVRAWVDDMPLASDTSDRLPDDDRHDASEPVATAEAQWLEAPVKIEVDPFDGASPVGACRLYTVRARAGTMPLDNFNLDMHVRAPDPQIGLCGASGSVAPPDKEHAAGPTHPADTTDCVDEGFACFHLEGATDRDGLLLFGLSSDKPGLASMTIWADGEPGTDTDTAPGARALAIAKTNWVGEVAEASVEIITHPAGGMRIGGDTFRVIAWVDAPYLVQRVLVFVSRGEVVRPVMIGEAERVGASNYYMLEWDLSVPLGTPPSPSPSPSASPSESPSPSPSPSSPIPPLPTPSVTPPEPLPSPTTTLPPLPAVGTRPGVPDATDYDLKVVIQGGGSATIEDVEVNRSLSPPLDRTQYESVEVTFPLAGHPVSFVDRATTIAGVATAAEGVDLFYATRSTIKGSTFAWTHCGYDQLGGLGTNYAQVFSGVCTLAPQHGPNDVLAVGAAAFDCTGTTGTAGTCADHPPPPSIVPPRGPGIPAPADCVPAPAACVPREHRGSLEGTAAVAVEGCEGPLCIALRPSRWRQPRGTCIPMSVQAAKPGEPAVGQPIAVEFQGPTDSINFCDPENERDHRWPGEENVEVDAFGPDLHRIIGKTNADGIFDFGVYSSAGTFESIFASREGALSRVTAWLDDGDAVKEPGEDGSTSMIHWEIPNRCTIVGTDRGEVISGTSQDDVICGRGGDDEIDGLDGNDLILGGDGDDVIHGGLDKDEIYGEAGDDKIFGDDQRDKIHGGAGADVIYGGRAADKLFGEADDDDLFGQRGDDKLDGGDGEDACDLGKGRKESAVSCETVLPPPEGTTGRYGPLMGPS